MVVTEKKKRKYVECCHWLLTGSAHMTVGPSRQGKIFWACPIELAGLAELGGRVVQEVKGHSPSENEACFLLLMWMAAWWAHMGSLHAAGFLLQDRERWRGRVVGMFEDPERAWCGTSLAVWWLRLRAPNVGGMGSILDQGTKNQHAAWAWPPNFFN